MWAWSLAALAAAMPTARRLWLLLCRGGGDSVSSAGGDGGAVLATSTGEAIKPCAADAGGGACAGADPSAVVSCCPACALLAMPGVFRGLEYSGTRVPRADAAVGGGDMDVECGRLRLRDRLRTLPATPGASPCWWWWRWLCHA